MNTPTHISVEPVKLTRESFRVDIKPDHPSEADGETEKTVDGFVSPSGVFGIDRRIDIEREAKQKHDELNESDELWIVTHIPTGRRIGFQLSFEAAHRNLDFLEPHAERMRAGKFGQNAKEVFDPEAKDRLGFQVYLAEHVAEMEFSNWSES